MAPRNQLSSSSLLPPPCGPINHLHLTSIHLYSPPCLPRFSSSFTFIHLYLTSISPLFTTTHLRFTSTSPCYSPHFMWYSSEEHLLFIAHCSCVTDATFFHVDTVSLFSYSLLVQFISPFSISIHLCSPLVLPLFTSIHLHFTSPIITLKEKEFEWKKNQTRKGCVLLGIQISTWRSIV